MEIQNISGPDLMPSTFSPERPQPAIVSADNESSISQKPAPVEEGRGVSVDTYA